MQTQTDLTTASEDAIRLWLATLPCPWFIDGDQTCNECENTGLALPWASEPCRPCFVCPEHGRGAGVDDDGCCFSCGADAPECDGGRVPKDVGLPELWEHGLTGMGKFADGTYWAFARGNSTTFAETPTLAALRAIAAQAGAGMR